MSVAWDDAGQDRRGPSWRELVDEAARKIGFRKPTLLRFRGTDLQILEYFRIKQHDNFALLTNWLLTTMKPPDDALKASRIHEELAALQLCRLFYTTNFDDFIERAFRLHGRPCTVVVIEEHMGRSGDSAEIIKFHGDFNHPTQMVISESHYEERLSLKSPMDYRLRADLLNRALLFIGYSFRDPNVSYLFSLINREFGRGLRDTSSGRRAFIIVAEPSDFEMQLFRARNIQVVPVSSGRMTEDVADLLKEIRG